MSTSTTTMPSSSSNNPKSPITVLGAGVLGLSTATLLQSRFPNRRIILLAAELPSASTDLSPSYASPWAGAHYRPISATTPQLRHEAILAQRTFSVMKDIALSTSSAGVAMVKGVEYFDRPGTGELGMKDGDVYAGPRDGFRVLRDEELLEGIKWGCEYETYVVNVPVYLGWLLERFVGGGGKVATRRVGGVMEGFEVSSLLEDGDGEEVSTVVNCSGTNFGLDPKVKIIRGQTVLVKNPYHRTVTRQYADGRWATLIPRPLSGGTIVGVSKEIGDKEEKPRRETRQLMLEQAVESFPDFVKRVEDFEVIKDYVGRRPFREGGLRMEVEEIDGGRKRIVHGYGAGGRGYELSWAVAERLVELVSGG